jgi:D-3-phosphoglycerate dehydrogenase / 2-oxoglutarate reductase
MSEGTVLVADPIGGDVSVIAATLAAHGFSTMTPALEEHWHDLADRADGLIVNLVTVDAPAFARLTRCRVIARLGVGINNIDTTAARARNVVVTNVPDYCREEVSDHALALILTMVRKIPLAYSDIQRGVWDQLGYRPIRRLNTLTLGLVGFGRLAQALARKARALGMRVIACDPYATRDPVGEVPLVPFHTLLGEADVLSLHVPLASETRGMIGHAEIRRLKSGAILINTSRGELVDEAALIAALDEGLLSAAALDVVAVEPLAATSPLLGRPNVLLTPHMAFYSEESLIDLQRTAAEDVAHTLSGRAPRYRAA